MIANEGWILSNAELEKKTLDKLHADKEFVNLPQCARRSSSASLRTSRRPLTWIRSRAAGSSSPRR